MSTAGDKRQTKKDERAKLSQSSRSAPPARNGLSSTESDELLLEIESLRTRLSKLSETCLRVSETLDLDVVLVEVIDSARSLTGARYGALLTYEQSGGIQEFITSGLSPGEIELLNTSPQGLGLLGYMNEIREPLRLSDISGHPSSVGFPENHPPMKTFLGMPIRHHGAHLGNIYLTEKEGGAEFTREDQDTLVMFASQAGAAISNARRYREELRAKADLEALVKISPVGVVVFDARTGDLVLANDEMRRLVGKLNPPGRSLGDLLAVIALRRADGSDIPTEELPTVKALTRGETILADEVVIHPPDGRRAITALVNARPIRQDDGDIVSVVATIQDITLMDDLKRQRAEFLRSVSRELRTPLSAIKGSTSTLLNSTYPLDPSETRQFLMVVDEQSDRMRHLINDLVDMTQIEAGAMSVSPEPTDMADLLDQARAAQIQAGASNDGVELDLPPDLPMAMADRRRVLQVLHNLLASVSSNSPRSSPIRMTAARKDVYVAVSVYSEGATGDSHPPRQLGRYSPAADEVAEMRNGRDAMGITISVGIVEAHGGRLSVEAGDGGHAGGFTFTIPVVDEAANPAAQEGSRSPSSRQPHEGRAEVVAFIESPDTGRYVRNILIQAGYGAVVAGNLDEAEEIIEAQNPHVILLEPTLPGAEGLDMLVRIGRISGVPVIVVAGHPWDRNVGRAFELGAFDYISKPFTSTELVTRIDVALRRSSAAGWKEPSVLYRHGDLTIDYIEREVSVAGCPVHLTATEYKLLVELSANRGRVSTHDQLLRRVWGPLYSTDSRIVRTYVKELRHKLGDDAARPTYIFTEPGVGYRMPGPSNGQRLRE